QGTFHLGSADAVPGHVDHVVDAPGYPQVAIGIAARAVAGEVVARQGFEVGVDHALMIAVYAADLPRPTGLDRQQPAAGALDQRALVVQQHRLHAEQRTGGATGLDVAGADQRAEHDTAGLGLPPGVDDRAALLTDFLEVPFPGFRVDRLAHAAQQAQA